MEDISCRLTLIMRNSEIGRQGSHSQLQMLPISSLHLITLCCMVTKRMAEKTKQNLDPIWHCFDIHIYSRDERENVMSNLQKLKSEIYIPEQNILIRPFSSITASLSGAQVDPYTAISHEFRVHTEERMQRSFHVYFNKKAESDNLIRLDFSLTYQERMLVNLPILFQWNKDEKTQRKTKSRNNFNVSGRRAFGIVNVFGRSDNSTARSNGLMSTLDQDDFCSQSDSSQTQPHSLSDTEVAECDMIIEDPSGDSKDTEHNGEVQKSKETPEKSHATIVEDPSGDSEDTKHNRELQNAKETPEKSHEEVSMKNIKKSKKEENDADAVKLQGDENIPTTGLDICDHTTDLMEGSWYCPGGCEIVEDQENGMQ